MSTYITLNEALLRDIRETVGSGAVITDPEKLAAFAKDGTVGIVLPPEAVVEVTETGQIQNLLRLANDRCFPVTPRGLGTGLAGGALPVLGGVVLSLARLNRILSLEPQNMLAVVEPGVVNQDLKNAARQVGLFYPPDPASYDTCSLGGNAATNAGGPSCVKYGTTRDYVLGLEAILPTGEKIAAGVQTRKGVVGYDLTRLLVGSEGTLAVITKLFLRLIPHPPAVNTLIALFPALEKAMVAIRAILQRGHTPCAMEFMDHRCLDLVGDLLPFPEAKTARCLLLIEADGDPAVIAAEIEGIGTICLQEGATEVYLAPDAVKRQRLWDIRKEVSLRIEDRYPLDIHEDVAVPLEHIADLVAELPTLEQAYGMRIFAFGHAGDGNIHLNVTADHPEDRPRVEEGICDLLRRVLAMGGTLSGEHGIGMTKKQYLPLELAPENRRLQRAIKDLFDPRGILNPGKIFT